VAAVPSPHRGRRFCRVQLLAARQRTALLQLAAERGESREPPRPFPLTGHGALVFADQQRITHDALPSSSAVLTPPGGRTGRWGRGTIAGMRTAERARGHQVPPAKIGADVTASVVSNVLLWRARPKAGIAVRVLLPLAGSAAVLRFADLDALARTGRGRYVLAHMPPSAQGVRLAGDGLMGLGAYRHRWALIIAGAAVVVARRAHAVWPSGAGHPGPSPGRPEPPDPAF